MLDIVTFVLNYLVVATFVLTLISAKGTKFHIYPDPYVEQFPSVLDPN